MADAPTGTTACYPGAPMNVPARFTVPARSGPAALGELDRVPWHELTHAYGRGRTGEGLHDDVAAALRRLGDDDPDVFAAGVDALYASICHQGTIYEATAHVVPFVAAVAAGEIWRGAQLSLAMLLGRIAIASSFETDDGGHAGAFGEDVADDTRAALRSAQGWLDALGGRDPAIGAVVTAIAGYLGATRITRAVVDRIRATVHAIEGIDPGPPPRPAAAVVERFVRHAKFGRGRVLSAGEGKLVIAFADGERCIAERFLTPE